MKQTKSPGQMGLLFSSRQRTTGVARKWQGLVAEMSIAFRILHPGVEEWVGALANHRPGGARGLQTRARYGPRYGGAVRIGARPRTAIA